MKHLIEQQQRFVARENRSRDAVLEAMDGGHSTNRSINRTTYHHIYSTTTHNYSNTTRTTHNRYNQDTSEPSKTSSKHLKQTPKGPAPFASFDSIASIDVTTPEERSIPTSKGNVKSSLIFFVTHTTIPQIHKQKICMIVSKKLFDAIELLGNIYNCFCYLF